MKKTIQYLQQTPAKSKDYLAGAVAIDQSIYLISSAPAFRHAASNSILLSTLS